VRVSEAYPPPAALHDHVVLGGATGSRSCLPPDGAVQPGHAGSVGQPGRGPARRRQADAFFTRARTWPSSIQDRSDHGHGPGSSCRRQWTAARRKGHGRRRTRRFRRVCSPVRPGRDSTEHGADGRRGRSTATILELRNGEELSAVPVDRRTPGSPACRQVRFTESVGGEHHYDRQQLPRRLAVADQAARPQPAQKMLSPSGGTAAASSVTIFSSVNAIPGGGDGMPRSSPPRRASASRYDDPDQSHRDHQPG